MMHDVLAWGLTFDLTISLPFLYWFFVVRRGKAQAVTVAPVFIAGTAAASFFIPSAQQTFLSQLKLFVLPLAELSLVTALVMRIRKLAKTPSVSNDAYERILAAARALLGETRVAEIVASEVAMVYYALFTWRRKAAAVPGHAFTVHERSGWGTILICIYVLIVAEGVGMHLLIAQWSTLAAWGWTALDLWAMLWLLGDYRGLVLRRSFISEEALHIRFGLRWNVVVPLTSIASIEDVHGEWQSKPGVLKVAILEDPRVLITFDEPVVAKGLAGLRKTIHAIALLPDDEETIAYLRTARSLEPEGGR
jgi:hypothetical protein